MSNKNQEIRDLRYYSKQTTVRLVAGGLGILILVGLGLIYLFYGINAMFSGLICVGAGLLPVLLIFAFFFVINIIIERSGK